MITKVKPADMATKVLMADLVEAIKGRLPTVEAAPILHRYGAWVESQKSVSKDVSKAGRPRFVLTPDLVIQRDLWAATKPRAPIRALAKALGCSLGKAHAIASTLPKVEPDPITINPCSQCGGEGELGAWEAASDPGESNPQECFDVKCATCPNQIQQHSTELLAIQAWNLGNPITP